METTETEDVLSFEGLSTPEHIALVVLAYPTDPTRVGEVAFLPEGVTSALGREPATGAEADVSFGRQAPAQFHPSAPLTARTLSRRHVVFTATGGELRVHNVGRAPLTIDGDETIEAEAEGRVRLGSTVAVGKTLLLGCTRRPERLSKLRAFPRECLPEECGGPDAFGFAGESAISWRLREQLAEVAARPDHVLVRGEEGSGRGLCARMIHGLSGRSTLAPIILNAAALDPSDATAFDQHLFTRARGSTLIIERADTLPAHIHARIADKLPALAEDGTRLVLTIDSATEAVTSLLLRRITASMAVPSFGDRFEDAWCWVLAAGAGRGSFDVGAMSALVGAVRTSGWTAVIAAVDARPQNIRAAVEGGSATGEALTDFDGFVESVREALRCFHDPARLQDSPLLTLRALARRERRLAVADLREVLRAAVERLERETDRELLRATYFSAAPKQAVIADRFNVPYSTYRRHLAKAAALLADRLWRDEHGEHEG